MNGKDGYMQHLLALFRPEAQEHIDVMVRGLLDLERDLPPGARAELVETIYREAHSLKGAARAVDMDDVEGLCQRLETVFAAMKRGALPITPRLLDVLHRGINSLVALLAGEARPGAWRDVAAEIEDVASRASEPSYEAPEWDQPINVPHTPAPVYPSWSDNGHAAAETTPLPVATPTQNGAGQQHHTPAPAPVATVASAAAPVKAAEPPRQQTETPLHREAPAETIRVASAKLDSLLLQTEELLSAKLTITHRSRELRDLSVRMVVWSKELARVQPELRAVQQHIEREERDGTPGWSDRPQRPLRSVLEFLEFSRAFHQSLATELLTVSRAADADQAVLATLSDTLLDGMKKVLMLPFAAFTEILPKLVRDVSRDCGKRVAFTVEGGEVEIDRRILEGLKDPLIHLLRNAVDHGIETPEQRSAAGKPEQGTLRLAIVQKDANKVELVVADDGGGIALDRVRAAAVKAGQPARDAEGLDDAAALALIFGSGVSTSPLITELSGRGLGLAIVREKVEKLGGTVTVESQPGQGTTFRLLLPLTLATCRAILLRVADRLFVLPTTHVERVVSVSSGDVKLVGGRETIVLEGQVLPLARLADALGLPDNTARNDHPRPAVVLGIGDKWTAFLVDAVLGEQEALVKNLGPQLVHVRNFSGATVLGDGKVVPILSAVDLMKASAAPRRVVSLPEPARVQPKSILVAEDSITSRTLLKNILETAGFRVRTAIDGVDALTALLSDSYDLLLTDVEMPRMNGFELTAQVRANNSIKDLPVVLVTSLESREDRERGVEAGANAYMVKRGFDGGNLLEVIGRLI